MFDSGSYLFGGNEAGLTLEVTEKTVIGFFYLGKRCPPNKRVGFNLGCCELLRKEIECVAELRGRQLLPACR
jgi:hypothetical protein